MEIENKENCNGGYSLSGKFFMNDELLAMDDDLLRRLHGHYLLHLEEPEKTKKLYTDRYSSHSGDGEKNIGGVAAGIESAIVDYLSCSFSSSPIIGEKGFKKCVEVHDKESIDYLRTLDNDLTFFHIPYEGAEKKYIDLGKVWGATFWEMREQAKFPKYIDKITIEFWNKLWNKYPDCTTWTNEDCYKILLQIVDKQLGKKFVDKTKAIFEKKKIA